MSPAAAPIRQLQFKLGRAAARDALAALGVGLAAIGRGGAGEPLWPAGIVGSISHTDRLAIAVVGSRQDYATIGVDVEASDRRISDGALALVGTPSELRWVHADPSDDTRPLRLFTAKEAVFKACFPLHGIKLDFRDVELSRISAFGFAVKAAWAAQPTLHVPKGLIGCVSLVHDLVFSAAYLGAAYRPVPSRH